MLTIHPTPQQLEQLRELRYRHPVAAVQKRAEIVLLVDWGIAYRNEIADFAGVHINTVTNTLHRFLKQGVDGLRQIDPDLPDPELDAFNHLMREECSRHPPAPLKQAAQQLEDATGIRRGLSAIRRLIERFWKHVKKACLTNRHYEDFAAFRHAIDQCLEESFSAHADEMKSLLVPNFQIISNSQIAAA